jgi:hypothetical protein
VSIHLPLDRCAEPLIQAETHDQERCGYKQKARVQEVSHIASAGTENCHEHPEKNRMAIVEMNMVRLRRASDARARSPLLPQ